MNLIKQMNSTLQENLKLDPTTGMAPIALERSFGNMIDDSKIRK